jgi:hypothetical protein
MSGSNNGSGKFLKWLLAGYGVLFVILAIHPVDRGTWRIEALFHRAPYGINSGWSSYEEGISNVIQDVR